MTTMTTPGVPLPMPGVRNEKRGFPTLLSSIRVGGHVLKNRFLYPDASPHFLQGPETFPAQSYRVYHSGVARNGAAVVLIAEWNNPDQRTLGPAEMDAVHMQAFDLSDPSVHNYLSLMADDIHFYGSKLLVSTAVDWPAGYSLHGGRHVGAPVANQPVIIDEPIPADRMGEVISAFVAKMRFYQHLGYDGMALGVLTTLLPPISGRTDRYAGETIESRSLFLREVLAAVKQELGPDFIIELLIPWRVPDARHEMFPSRAGGVTPDEIMAFCTLMDPYVDIFQVQEPDGTLNHPTGYNFAQGKHPAVIFSARMKAEGITALVAPVGGFQEPEEMEEYLVKGMCDMFGVARAFIVDPEYGKKMLSGRSSEIVPCLKCNMCHGTWRLNKVDPWLSVCAVNPTFGIEHELPYLVTQGDARRICVIGGGPIGLRAAIFAAEQGHSVTLYEKANKLGGQLEHSDYFDFKWPLKNYRDWLLREVDRVGVEVKLGAAPEPAEIRALDFDAVIAATGAADSLPSGIEGLTDEHGAPRYPTCDAMWGRADELGDHVIIVGGSEAGMEMAIHLLRGGRRVTVLTRQEVVASDASQLHYITMSFLKILPDGGSAPAPEWERYDRLTTIEHAKTIRVDDNTVVYVDEEGTRHVVEGDDILICGGHVGRIEDAMRYAESAPQFYAIGDCVGAGDLQAGNRQAFGRVMTIQAG